MTSFISVGEERGYNGEGYKKSSITVKLRRLFLDHHYFLILRPYLYLINLSQYMNDQHFEISEFKSKSGVKRIFSAFFYSIDGFRTAWKFEHAFRQELMIAIPGIIIAVLLPVTGLERIALIAVLVQVLIIELLNSAIEAVVDRVSLDKNPLSKNAKDLGSAAVMLAFFLAIASWAVIVVPLVMK